MKKILRIYPIRTTRKKWDIKLYRYHNCTENCNIKFIADTEYHDQILIINNPYYKDGKCENYNKIQPTLIRLVDFDEVNSEIGNIGKLFNSNVKVIPDNSFTVSISFPLSCILEINISSDNNNGFTLTDIIKYIKIFYTFIYEEEERTASSQVYNLKKICYSCRNKDLLKYVSKIEQIPEEECSICYNNYDKGDNISKLNCSHIFHNECIKKWFLNSGTCPMCRSNVFECKQCDGSGIISYQFTGVVIPIEYRGVDLNRNSTDGIFGIYNYDFEDLMVESLRYDRIKKYLHINIIS